MQPLNNEQIAEGLIVKLSGQALRSSIMKFIRAYVDDLQQQSRKGKKKDEEDKKKANEFRDKPMETLKRSKLLLTQDLNFEIEEF